MIFKMAQRMKKQRYYLVFILALLINLSAVNAETRLKLSDLSPGTEITSIVINGDFENGDTGWRKILQYRSQSAPLGTCRYGENGNTG